MGQSTSPSFFDSTSCSLFPMISHCPLSILNIITKNDGRYQKAIIHHLKVVPEAGLGLGLGRGIYVSSLLLLSACLSASVCLSVYFSIYLSIIYISTYYLSSLRERGCKKSIQHMCIGSHLPKISLASTWVNRILPWLFKFQWPLSRSLIPSGFLYPWSCQPKVESWVFKGRIRSYRRSVNLTLVAHEN